MNVNRVNCVVSSELWQDVFYKWVSPINISSALITKHNSQSELKVCTWLTLGALVDFNFVASDANY